MFAVIVTTSKFISNISVTNTRTFVEFAGTEEECQDFVDRNMSRYKKTDSGNITVRVGIVEIGVNKNFFNSFAGCHC